MICCWLVIFVLKFVFFALFWNKGTVKGQMPEAVTDRLQDLGDGIAYRTNGFSVRG